MRAGDFPGELNAKSVLAFYRHELRRNLDVAQCAAFARSLAWVAGEAEA